MKSNPNYDVCFFLTTGVTMFLCVLAIAVLGTSINAPTVMLANFVATPIELRSSIIINLSKQLLCKKRLFI